MNASERLARYRERHVIRVLAGRGQCLHDGLPVYRCGPGWRHDPDVIRRLAAESIPAWPRPTR